MKFSNKTVKSLLLLFSITTSLWSASPVITSIPDKIVLEDSATSIVDLNISDADAEELIISSGISDADLATLEVTKFWKQVGSNIGEGILGDQNGYSVSLSSDGLTVALGAIYSNGFFGTNSGRVKIYKYNSGIWTQVGSSIDGEARSDYSGWSVSLSADGLTVAIGSSNNDGVNGENSGHVRVYKYNGSAWVQAGEDIDGEGLNDLSGTSVSLSADGLTVAIGAPWNDGFIGNGGHVRIYKYNGSAWVQSGGDIDGGEGLSDASGTSVSLSSDGSRVAIGTPFNDGVNGEHSGHVRVYQYTGSFWAKLGGDIDGEAAFDESGHSVSLSANGSIVAIGAYKNDGVAGINSGHVRIYKYITGTWTQLGLDIDGKAPDDNSGRSVSLSADGLTVAIGAYERDGLSTADSGDVRIYKYNGTAWIQVGADVYERGNEVSLSADGLSLAIGVPIGLSGHVHVHKLIDRLLITPKANANGTATVTITADDETGNVVNSPFNLTVTSVNDAPTSANTSFTIDEYTVKRFTSSDFSFTDVDVGATLSSIDITTLPTHGTLKLSGTYLTLSDGILKGSETNVMLNQQIPVGDISNLTFTPAANENGTPYDSFAFKVNDSEINSISAYTMTANVNAIADEPVTTISVKTVEEDSPTSVVLIDMGDPHSITATISDANLATLEITDFWKQAGVDIDGESSSDYSGSSVSLSADGLTVAIGAPNNDAHGSKSGHVRIYKYVTGIWTQVGLDIDGEAAYDYSGGSVSLSADGLTVAIGASNNAGNGSASGHVRIYKYNGSAWVQAGTDIDGEAAGDQSSSSVSLSADGLSLAIGAHKNDGVNGTDSGHVRIYKYNGTAWIQSGADIDGESSGDQSGSSVSLSADGLSVAIGAKLNYVSGRNSGYVRIYKYNGSVWVQAGGNIDGEAPYDQSGGSVSLSADGLSVAIGAHNNAGINGAGSGHVRIYKYNGSAWVQAGGDIDGEASGDNSGRSVSLSEDGLAVAIGAYKNDGVNGLDSGHIRIYKYNGTTWIQSGADIDGEGFNNQSGCSVSLSADASSVAIGGQYNNGINGSGSGHVRLYNVEDALSITPKPNANGTATVTVSADDGTGNIINSPFYLTVTSVKDSPTSANTSFTITEDSVKIFASSDFNFTDIDAGGSLDAIYITTLPSAGTLKYADVNVVLNQQITQENISSLTFIPVTNANGTPYSSFGFKVSDGDVNSTLAYTVTININARPTITSAAIITADEDSLYSYTTIGTDAEGDTLTWSATLPSWLSLNTIAPVVSNHNFSIASTTQTYFEIDTDSDGNVFLVDGTSTSILKITPAGVKTTFVGGDGSFTQIIGLAIDSANNIYVSDAATHQIKKITPTGVVSIFAGSTSGFNDAPGESAQFNNPSGLAIDKDDNLYVADKSNHRIRKITPSAVVTTIIGDGTAGITNTRVSNPQSLEVDSNNNLYISCSEYHIIRKITPSGDISTFAGVSGISGSVDGMTTNAEFNSPWDISIDKQDNLFVSDKANHTIRKITPAGEVSTYSGTASLSGSNNGDLASATYSSPINSTIDKYGNLYILDTRSSTFNLDTFVSTYSYRIRKITPPIGLFGTPTNTDVGVHDVNLTLSDSNGGVTQQNFQITVSNVNDIPTSINASFTIDEDTNKTFALNDFNFTDIDLGDSLESIYITSLESDGNLTLYASEVTLNQEITAANIPNLVFTPVSNAYGTPYTTFGFKVNDGDVNSTSAYTATINVTSVDDAPILDPISSQSQSEDFNDFNLTLTSTDTEGHLISYTVGSSNPAIANVSIVDDKVVITPIDNAFGNIIVEVNATANGQTATQTFDLNITAVDDAPTLASITNPTDRDEDFADFNITLVATDIENNPLTFSATSQDTSKATVSLTNNQLVISSVANASGTVSIDINVTQILNARGVAPSLTDSQRITFTIDPVNDAPTVTTSFADFSITEKSGSSNYDLNVTDIEGEDVNVTIDSNNTSLLTVTPNWTGFISQANYTDYLDFNLTTVADANGVVRISINVNDSDKNSTRSFDVNVTAVNDAPILNVVTDQTKAENFIDFNITLNATDIDNTNLIYSAISNDTDKATLKITGDQLVISSVANTFGVVSIDINVSDGELSDTQSFNLNIISDGDDDSDGFTPAAGDCNDADSAIYPSAIEIVDNGIDEDCSGSDLLSPTPTPTPTPTQAGELDTGLILDGTEDNETTIILSFTNENNGTQSTIHIPKIEGKTITTTFSSDAIEFTLDDGTASYNNNGTTKHFISIDNKATIATSYIAGSLVEFTGDGGVQTSVKSSDSDILIVATSKGHSQNSIIQNSLESRAESTIVGTRTVIQEDGDVVVNTPVVLSSLGNEITTQTSLDANGNIVVSALRIRSDGTVEPVSVGLGSFSPGSEVKIQNIDGAVVVEVITGLEMNTFTIRNRK